MISALFSQHCGSGFIIFWTRSTSVLHLHGRLQKTEKLFLYTYYSPRISYITLNQNHAIGYITKFTLAIKKNYTFHSHHLQVAQHHLPVHLLGYYIPAEYMKIYMFTVHHKKRGCNFTSYFKPLTLLTCAMENSSNNFSSLFTSWKSGIIFSFSTFQAPVTYNI